MFERIVTLLNAGLACPACGASPSPGSFPLCEDCDLSRVDGRPLCARCGSALCPARGGECLRPWLTLEPLAAIHARYLLAEPWYSVLKRWKTRGGPLFDRKVLKPDAAAREFLRRFAPDWIVPIPQSLERAWRLGGSPALRISLAIGRELGLAPVAALLPGDGGGLRQAQKSFRERFASRARFQCADAAIARLRARRTRVLLVDDFFTTGQTLRQAARVLLAHGAREVGAYVLGIRPDSAGGLSPLAEDSPPSA